MINGSWPERARRREEWVGEGDLGDKDSYGCLCSLL